MFKKRELDSQLNNISSKLGAMFVGELLGKQYKMNYYQRIRIQSQAFHKWKLKHREALEREQKAIKKIKNSKDPASTNKRPSLKIKDSSKNKRKLRNDRSEGIEETPSNKTHQLVTMHINKHKVGYNCKIKLINCPF